MGKKGILPLKRTKSQRNLNCHHVKLFWTDHVLYVDTWFCVILLNNLLIEGTQRHGTIVLPTSELWGEKTDQKLSLENLFIVESLRWTVLPFISFMSSSQRNETSFLDLHSKNHRHHHHFFSFIIIPPLCEVTFPDLYLTGELIAGYRRFEWWLQPNIYLHKT